MGANLVLEEGPKVFAVERQEGAHRSAKEAAKGCRRKILRYEGIARGERLPKNLVSLGFGRRATPAQKTLVVQKLRQKHALKPQNQGNTEGLAAQPQTASPFSRLNNFYFKILSNFFGGTSIRPVLLFRKVSESSRAQRREKDPIRFYGVRCKNTPALVFGLWNALQTRRLMVETECVCSL